MPTQQIDVYRDWLKIEETKRPLNYYQLLKLKKFEDDPVRIRSHYRQLNAHVRKFAAGEYASQSQALLNELAKAMLCLTDSKRKSEYDASLGRIQAAPGKQRTIEELLLLRKVIDREQLDKARGFAEAVGVDIHDALVQQKLAKPEIVMQIYAESLGVPYIDLAETGVDLEWVPQVPVVLARQNSCVPVMVDDGQILMASPHLLKPEIEEELRLRLGLPVRPVLCTAAGINMAITRYYPKEAAAAELKAGPKKIGAPAAAAPAQAASGAGGKAEAKPAAKEGPSLTPAELKKQNRMITIMTFNFTFMAAVFYQILIQKPPATFMQSLTLALIIGVAAAAMAFFGTKFRGK